MPLVRIPKEGKKGKKCHTRTRADSLLVPKGKNAVVVYVRRRRKGEKNLGHLTEEGGGGIQPEKKTYCGSFE